MVIPDDSVWFKSQLNFKTKLQNEKQKWLQAVKEIITIMIKIQWNHQK